MNNADIHRKPQRHARVLDVGCALFSALVVLLATSTVRAQCSAPAWVGGFGNPGMNGSVHALLRIPNGDIIAGGQFLAAGNVGTYIARWNGSQWTAMGGGMNNYVYALALMENGDVLAGGIFTMAGGMPANRIARWDGSAWHSLGSGMNSTGAHVRALAVLPNQDVIAGGSFSSAGGAPVSNIARWNGTSWSPLGTGFDGWVRALAVLPDNSVIAGGDLGNSGEVRVPGIGRWNGTTWTSLGANLGTTSGIVNALAVTRDGRVLAGGVFTTMGGTPVHNLAAWNGSGWSDLGGGVTSTSRTPSVYALTQRENGDVVLGGGFTNAGNIDARFLTRWDGFQWHRLSAPGPASNSGVNDEVYALAVGPDGDLFAGGSFSIAGGAWAYRIARFDFGNSCPADFNCSGGSEPLNAQDIFDFVAAWFAGDADADFNALGGLSVSDIFDFLNAWFAGC